MRILENNEIRLRAVEPEDLDLLYSIENKAEFWELSSTLAPFSKELLKRYIDNAHLDIYEAKQLRLIIVNSQDDTVLGMIDLFDYEPMHRRAGLGILILERFQNKGYASKALKVFINYAFKHLKIHQLYANILSENTQSKALFEKMKFTRVGTKKEWILTGGGYKNVELYQLIDQSE